MKDWAQYLEGFTGNEDALMEKCRAYIAELRDWEIPLFHADLMPYHLAVNELELRMLERLGINNWDEMEPVTDEGLRAEMADYLNVTAPIRFLAAAFNERVMVS